MCYWGVAYRARPEHQRADHARRRRRRRGSAIEQARSAAPKRDREGARVHRGAGEALRRRSEGRAAAARSRLRRGDARASSTRFPDDLDAATLFAQSLMDTVAVELLGRRTAARARSPATCSRRSSRCWRGSPITSAPSISTSTPSKRRRIRGAPSSTPTGSPRSCPAPAISCTCRRTSTCAPAATTTRRSRTRTRSRPTRRTSQAIAVAGNMMYEVGYYPHNIHFFVDVGVDGGAAGRRAEGGRRGARARCTATCCAIRRWAAWCST